MRSLPGRGAFELLNDQRLSSAFSNTSSDTLTWYYTPSYKQHIAKLGLALGYDWFFLEKLLAMGVPNQSV